MSNSEKRFLIYFPIPVLLIGILLPLLLEDLRIDEFISAENIVEGGWIAVAYLASSYVLLSIISLFIRNSIIMIPPFIGIVLIQAACYVLIFSSKSTTAALGYIAAPLIQILIAIPAGMLVGFWFNKRRIVDYKN
jgi:hypothetical protein